MTEAEFQKQVLQLAEQHGWVWVHVRQSRAKRGYGNATSGPMGKGWPDLVLLHSEKRKMLFVELKADGGTVSGEQRRVHIWLAEAGHPVNVWRPSDSWDSIEWVLRGEW